MPSGSGSARLELASMRAGLDELPGSPSEAERSAAGGAAATEGASATTGAAAAGVGTAEGGCDALPCPGTPPAGVSELPAMRQPLTRV